MGMNKAKTTGIIGMIAASIGSICCVGPVILTGLGLGTGVLSFVRSFGFLHMPMMILAVGLLATAFFFHFKKSSSDSLAECCNTPNSENKATKIFLWTGAVLTLFLFLFPYFI